MEEDLQGFKCLDVTPAPEKWINGLHSCAGESETARERRWAVGLVEARHKKVTRRRPLSGYPFVCLPGHSLR